MFNIAACWRRGLPLMVTTSVFGWRTFPDLRLMYGWHVTTSWVNDRLLSPNSAFYPFGVGKRVVIHGITWITEVETINGRQGLRMAG